jgi:hypothetical protein
VSEGQRDLDGYQCGLVPDEQAALQAEIDRLANEHAALREQLATARPPPAERPGERAKPEKGWRGRSHFGSLGGGCEGLRAHLSRTKFSLSSGITDVFRPHAQRVWARWI